MITIKDVALKAGVPVRMAARALSGATLGKRRDARERAERIRQAAVELGYCPSEIAVALTRGQTRTIGLLLPNLTDMFYAAASEIAMDEAAKYGYSIVIRLTRFRPELAAENIERFRSARVDGILYGDDCYGLPAEQLELLRRQRFPFQTFNQPNSCGFSSVAPDRSSAIREAVEMLTGRGHSQISFAAFQKNHLAFQTDAERFLEVCSEYGARGELCWQEHMNEYRTLAAEHRDALLICGKYSMRMFQDSIAADPGYRPDLIGFYNEWTWASASAFRLRGVIMDQAELTVRSAIRLIIEQIGDCDIHKLAIPSAFYPEKSFTDIHVLDLTNQYLDYGER